MISMRILQGFQAILIDFYKDFYKDSKGFDDISMMVLVESLSGFWRIYTGQAFYRNSTRLSTMVPLGFKGVLKDFYMVRHGFLCGISKEPMGIYGISKGIL